MAHSKIYDRDQSFWESYSQSRQPPPPSLFETLYTYHSSHTGSFNTLNDIGAGIGWISRQFTPKFRTVILTEPAPDTLATARHLLGADSHFQFVNAAGEADTQPEGSVDVVVAFNVLQFLDLDRFAAAAARQLRSGGTLCVATWPLPRFDDEEFQTAWTEMMDDIIRPFMGIRGEDAVQEVLTKQDSNTECLGLSSGEFEVGVKRIRINWMHDGLDFVQAPETSKMLGVQRISRVGLGDEVVEEKESVDWRFEKTVEEIGQMTRSYPFNPSEEAMERHLEVFRGLLDTKGESRCAGHWPVSITLATRR